jgi:hypothetical protein
MKFTFQNLQSKAVTLVIEPWTMAERVEPDASVVFEVSDEPPPEIEFAMTAEGDPFISVVSDVVRFRAGGKDREFTS